MDLQGVIPYLVFIPLDAATITDSELLCKSASRNSNSVLYGKAMASQFTSVDIFFNLHVIRSSNRIKTKKKNSIVHGTQSYFNFNNYYFTISIFRTKCWWAEPGPCSSTTHERLVITQIASYLIGPSPSKNKVNSPVLFVNVATSGGV